MRTIHGQTACNGIAIGPFAHFSPSNKAVPAPCTVADSAAELARFEAAKKTTGEQLAALYEKALAEVGEEDAQIFEIHQMMLEDLDYCEGIEGIIEGERLCAEWAVSQTGEQFSAMFAAMDDEYMQARAADVKDISTRLVDVLMGHTETKFPKGSVPVIVGSADLAPSQTIQMDKALVLSFVLEEGSANSHAAILSRSLGIPSLVSCGKGALEGIAEGETVIVDGQNGLLIASPDAKTLAEYEKKLDRQQREKEGLALLKTAESVTKGGIRVEICANIGSPEEAAAALEAGAEGIGLFRSEFLYMGSDHFPTEDEQYAAYSEALKAMEGRRVVVRTLDLGADKHADYFDLPHEENPALGYRAIRICLAEPDIFKPQLRALLRASVHGKLAILFPMITGIQQVEAIVQQVDACKQELAAEGKPVANQIELGLMIETPAAAVISDLLAPMVDFFSIGTNDLTQYTLAADRMNNRIAELYDPGHPAILRLMELATKNAHAAGKWVGICGESAADPALTRTFLEMGIDELSVSAPAVLPLRAAVRNLDI